MQRALRIITALIVIAVSATLASFWITRDQSLSNLQQAGTIQIGYAVEPPYAFIAPDGSVTGQFPAVARHLAYDLGISHIEWIQTDFDALIPGLEAGRFDVIAAGMYITPDRAQHVAFSEPLFHVQQGLLVQVGNPKQLSGYHEAVHRTDVRLAVIAGAVEEDLLRRMGVPEERIVLVPDARTGHAAVVGGIADGLALSAPTIRWMATENTFAGMEMVEPFVQPDAALMHGIGYPAFAFRPGDRQLLQAWNTALSAFVATAEYRQIMAAFGFVQAELPGSITTIEVLAP